MTRLCSTCGQPFTPTAREIETRHCYECRRCVNYRATVNYWRRPEKYRERKRQDRARKRRSD